MVELLAVVAVIMVLLSILFPLWAGMRIKSTRLADMSNMRNFASACVASASDSDGYLPIGERESSVNRSQGDDLVWNNSGEMYRILTNYMNDRRMFSCVGYHLNNGWKNYPASYGPVGSHGGFIGWTYLTRRRVDQAWPMVNKDGSLKGTNYVHLTRLSSDSTRRTLAGCMSWTGPVYSGNVAHTRRSEAILSQPTSGKPYHYAQDLAGSNIGYLDGSASWVNFDDLAVMKDVDFMLYDPRRR